MPLILQLWGLFRRLQLARLSTFFHCDQKREVPRWPWAPLSRPAAPTDGKPHKGRGLPNEKRGRLPARDAHSASAPGREDWVKPRRLPPKGRRKRLPPDPRKVDRDPPHVAPPKPVSLTKATAESASFGFAEPIFKTRNFYDPFV